MQGLFLEEPPLGAIEADGNLQHYAINRSLLLDGMRQIGIDRLAPCDGAFYDYADVSDFTTDSMTCSATVMSVS